jgi:hypothetical protein
MPVPPRAVRVWLYSVPIVAAGNGEAVVTTRVIGRVNVPEVELLLLSVTCTLNDEVTAVEDGIPERTPAELIVSQVGWLVTDHV